MIYEYKCDNCAHEFSVEQKITEEPLSKCPKCKKHTARRQISKCSFTLKGGGWASSGYASDKPKSK